MAAKERKCHKWSQISLPSPGSPIEKFLYKRGSQWKENTYFQSIRLDIWEDGEKNENIGIGH